MKRNLRKNRKKHTNHEITQNITVYFKYKINNVKNLEFFKYVLKSYADFQNVETNLTNFLLKVEYRKYLN